MDDRIGTGEAFGRLAELGQVSKQELRRRICRPRDVDAEYLMVVLEQVANDTAPRLAAGAGDDDPHSGRLFGAERVNPPRWWGLTLSGTPAPACRRNISTTSLLGVPNTSTAVVASTVSA